MYDHCAQGSAAVDTIIVQGTVSSRCVIQDIAGCDHCAVDSAAVDV